MKITCQACQAKYTIADEKVLGKVVKIRCKKCGATIVVDGNNPAAHAGSSRPPPPSPSFEHAAHAGQRDAWTVNVNDNDQRTMSAPEVVAAYRAGHVNEETFCWKDGMSDWLALREIPSLFAACTAPRARATPDSANQDDELPTRIQDASTMLGAARAATAARQSAGRQAAPEMNGHHGSASASGNSAAVARRTAGRAPAADLFGGAAHAGGEEEVLTSAPAGMAGLHDDAHKATATGARNENSVLFSLTALSSRGAEEDEKPNAIGEASGLIDIRQLSAQLHSDDLASRSRVEDIMNLGGGGAFNPALAAPILSAPSITHFPSAAPGGSGRFQNVAKGKPLVLFALGAGAFVVVAAIGTTAVLMRGKDEPPAEKQAMSASARPAAPATTEQTASAAPVVANAHPDGTGVPATPPAAHENVLPSSEPVALPARAGSAVGEVPKEAARAQPKEPKAAPTSPKEGMPGPTAGGSDQPFNMGEAKARLAAVAGAIQSCKRGEA
ncbi:MAG: zinc-ribbon domain-containing protein, partial [Myxococcota bacterium]|nr:zinc-ribbon domain-containing protein [Myxococcota bacterium]